ncbi:MAG: adenine deaminase [Lewinellaceae bacterium]|nr:adenine deaminase [Saprospiraceae bacterium]MCB9340308.1 adenine deaminase [Lewinellaceae bacterium]
MRITGNIIDIHQRKIFFGELSIENGIITDIQEMPGESLRYILPGFVDAHVHIESSMLVPTEFARMAVVHGTVATVSDPHEIANVMGGQGIRFMLDNAEKTPFKFFFGAPSCVPATMFETAGANLHAGSVEYLLKNPDIWYLSEMMNYPGVLQEDEEVMKKLTAAKTLGKPIDGHAPGLMGDEARRYFLAGITTDHECFTYEEGLEKAKLGVKILIREGSAAKNFDALIPLLESFPDQIMLCSDDKHPDDLAIGHINQLVARALQKGFDFFDVLRSACLNPVEHYKLPVGLLRVGDPADFILTNDIEHFTITETYVDGKLVAENGTTKLPNVLSEPVNNFNTSFKTPDDFAIHLPISYAHKPNQQSHQEEAVKLRVIKALDGQLITDSFWATAKSIQGRAVADPDNDILKITVINRYEDASPSTAFVHGFGLKRGAIASSVGHDSHNILAVGTEDRLLCQAVNLIIENKGGIAAVSGGGEERLLQLPVAGIMSTQDGYEVGQHYAAIDNFVKEVLGSNLSAPFMTLSFMALLVIPALKLSDKGLFDGKEFRFVGLFE